MITYTNKFKGINITYSLSNIFSGISAKKIAMNRVKKGLASDILIGQMSRSEASKRSSSWKNGVKSLLLDFPEKGESSASYEERMRSKLIAEEKKLA